MKDIVDILKSIDVSLQILANVKSGGATSAFVSKKTVASKLGVPLVTVDKLIHQGIVSKGKSGLVEGRHYCKLDPLETNTGNFLFDTAKVLQDAWSSFTGYTDETHG
jgi:hypothetical protein